MKRGALIAALLCTTAGTAMLAFANDLDEHDADARVLTQSEARRVLNQALPTPTPFDSKFIVEVTDAGNVIVNGRATGVFIVGQAPIGVVPQACREDYRRLPRGTTVVCMPDDHLYRRAVGEE